LPGADRGGVSGRPAADNGDVVDGVWQSQSSQLDQMMEGKGLILEQEPGNGQNGGSRARIDD
jgi:hypothetical protein